MQLKSADTKQFADLQTQGNQIWVSMPEMTPYQLLVFHYSGWSLKKKKSRVFYLLLYVGNNELSACILYKTMLFLHKHQAFYFRYKMFLSKEMKWFSTFILKALQGTPYTLLVYLSRAAFILLANQPGWNVSFYYWTPSRNFRK